MFESRKIPPVYADHQRLGIHIDIQSYGHQYEMHITGGGRRQRYKVDLLPKDLYQLNNSIRDAFNHMTSREGSKSASISKLAEECHLAFLKIFSKSARVFLKELLALDLNSIIEVTSDIFFIPWELLYLAGTDEIVSIDNFLGARHIISRIIDLGDAPFVSPYIYQAIPRVGLLTNNDLRAVRTSETPFFERLSRSKKITLLKMGILNPNRHQAGIMDFELFLAGHMDVTHFACHAYGNPEHSQSSIILSDEFAISHNDLLMMEDLILADNPIVVLNACGTGNIDSQHASFFAKDFLKFGARGVIATDCEIPDNFASEFSAHFYPNFLNGENLGNALFKTRRHFIEKQNNPTALIYSLYGTPFIKLINTSLATNNKQ